MSLICKSLTGSSPGRPSELVSVKRNNSWVAIETDWPGGSSLKKKKKKSWRTMKKFQFYTERKPGYRIQHLNSNISTPIEGNQESITKKKSNETLIISKCEWLFVVFS